MSAKIKPSPGAIAELTGPVPARVVSGDAVYAMYSAERLTPDGAFLAGPMLLEIDEECTLALAVGADDVRVRARTVQLIRTDRPGMVVVFPDMEPEERARIEALIEVNADASGDASSGGGESADERD